MGNRIEGFDNDAYAFYYITQGNAAASAAITAGTPVEVGGTATAGPVNDFTIATASGGRATYNGPGGTFHISVGMSMTSTKSNENMLFYVAIDGTEDAASEALRKLGTGADLGRGATGCITALTTGQYVEVFVDLAASSSDTVTANTLQVRITQVGP